MPGEDARIASLRERGIAFSRRSYLPRVSGFFLGAVAVAAVLWPQQPPLWLWLWLFAVGIVWPHVAHQLAIRNSHPFRVEFRNLLIDSVLVAFWLPVMGFNLALSATFVLILNLNSIASGGLVALVRGTLMQLLGVGAGVLLVGFRWEPLPTLGQMLAVLPFLLSHPLLIGYIVYDLARKLAQQKRRLQELSRTDSLTGLGNRGYWEWALGEEFNRARRTREPAALLLLDIDHFKRINDNFGHAAGDGVLRRVATVLREGLRSIDAIGRYGGEEFGVVLPHTDGPTAMAVAERMRRAVENAPVDVAGIDGVTISAGVAVLSDDLADARAWLAAADAALYRAKAGGRNRVVMDGPLTAAPARTGAEARHAPSQ